MNGNRQHERRGGAARRVWGVGVLLTLWSALLSPAMGSPSFGSAGGGAPFYVLLIGHAEAPAGSDLPPLGAVEDDVLRMVEFFRMLRPRRMIAHIRPNAAVWAQRPGVERRAATRAAVAETVDELRRAMAADVEPVVYVYYAGHGERRVVGGATRTRLFLEPGGADDGVVDSEQLSATILEPLGAVGTVHFIADACQSFYLLETREVVLRERVRKRHPGPGAGLIERFVERHPRVGMVLATNGSQLTYEDPALGGLFSHALRSAAVGAGDLDGDGLVTYGELAAATTWIMAGRAGAASPGILGPGGRDDVPFIDLGRLEAAAPVIFDPASARRYRVLTDDLVPFATVYPAGEERVWLEPSRDWYFVEDHGDAPREWWRLAHGGEGGQFGARRTPVEGWRTRGHAPQRLLGLFPLPMAGAVTVERARPPVWQPRPFVGLGAAAVLDVAPGGLVGVGVGTGAAATLRLGQGAGQWVAEGVWTFGEGEAARDQRFTLDRYGGGVGYLRVLVDGRFEVAVGGGVDLAWVRQVDRSDEQVFTSMGGGADLRALALVPVAAAVATALRFEVRAGTAGVHVSADEGFDWAPMIRLLAGVDWEVAR